jgi:hypothetical protein
MPIEDTPLFRREARATERLYEESEQTSREMNQLRDRLR